MRKFQYQNIHEIPRLEKIVVSRGVGARSHDPHLLETLSLELTKITAQCSVSTRARTAISRFKIRKGLEIGLKVTLRGERMYAFFDRLVNLSLPRIRDFQGVRRERFDGTGNYNLGLREQLIFPEIQYDTANFICGLNISIVTSAKTVSKRLAMLGELGVPFQR